MSHFSQRQNLISSLATALFCFSSEAFMHRSLLPNIVCFETSLSKTTADFNARNFLFLHTQIYYKAFHDYQFQPCIKYRQDAQLRVYTATQQNLCLNYNCFVNSTYIVRVRTSSNLNFKAPSSILYPQKNKNIFNSVQKYTQHYNRCLH